MKVSEIMTLSRTQFGLSRNSSPSNLIFHWRSFRVSVGVHQRYASVILHGIPPCPVNHFNPGHVMYFPRVGESVPGGEAYHNTCDGLQTLQ